MLPIGSEKIIFGKLQIYRGKFSITNPDNIKNQISQIEAFYEPVYPLSKGVHHRQILGLIERGLKLLENFSEWHQPEIITEFALLPFSQALKIMHRPEQEITEEHLLAIEKRLAFDELLSYQLTIQNFRRQKKL